jgi:hypothetical protein
VAIIGKALREKRSFFTPNHGIRSTFQRHFDMSPVEKRLARHQNDSMFEAIWGCFSHLRRAFPANSDSRTIVIPSGK